MGEQYNDAVAHEQQQILDVIPSVLSVIKQVLYTMVSWLGST